MARRNNHAGSRRPRKSQRAKQQHQESQNVSWPGKVARRIKARIKKLVG